MEHQVEIHTAQPYHTPTVSSEDNVWHSCCLKVDRHAVIYFVQIFFVFCMSAVCVERIVHYAEDCNNRSTFMSILTALIGFILPSPRFRGD